MYESRTTQFLATILRRQALSMRVMLILAGLSACSGDIPTAERPSATERTAPTSPASTYPPPSGPSAIYDRVTPSFIPGSSRYVLGFDGTFRLQYLRPDWGFFEYPGTYLRADSVLTLSFAGWNTAGPWVATGILRGDSTFVVKTNGVMSMADFEDGVYRSKAPLPGVARIYIANADGSSITALTIGDWPSWSPDGKRIAFHRGGTRCGCQIHVIDADGRIEVRLNDGSFPAWSPDGKRIAFTNTAGIAVMNADGSGVATIIRHGFRGDTGADSDMGVGKPAWSPDGTRIAFEHFGDGDMQPAQSYVMNADGSEPLRLTSSSDTRRYAESDPSWSPDGSRIVFWSYGYGIATVAGPAGQPTSVYKDFPTVAYGARPTWSTNGSLAFGTYQGSPTGASILILPGDGRGVKVLVSGGRNAAWSPDGKRIAFTSTGVR